MTIGIWVLGDQLWDGQSALQSCAGQAAQTPVILIESLSHAQRLPYHLQKLVLLWSAMRHFAEELRQANWAVTYARSVDFKPALVEWIQQHQITELRVMSPVDRPFACLIQQLDLPCPITLTPNNRFIWSDEEFLEWAKPRKRLVMEDFYREGRRRFNVLMVGDQPAGGRWNFDRDNRKPPKGKLNLPEALWFEPDAITQEVIDWVKQSPAFPRQPSLLASGAVSLGRDPIAGAASASVLYCHPTGGLRPLPGRDGDRGGDDVARHAVALLEPGTDPPTGSASSRRASLPRPRNRVATQQH